MPHGTKQNGRKPEKTSARQRKTLEYRRLLFLALHIVDHDEKIPDTQLSVENLYQRIGIGQRSRFGRHHQQTHGGHGGEGAHGSVDACPQIQQHRAVLPQFRLQTAQQQIAALFARSEVLVKKRTKSGGEAELDLKPMIFELELRQPSTQELEMAALVAAQNPSCNPQLLVNAIERYLPEQKPDFARIKRLEIYDEQGNPFR